MNRILSGSTDSSKFWTNWYMSVVFPTLLAPTIPVISFASIAAMSLYKSLLLKFGAREVGTSPVTHQGL